MSFDASPAHAQSVPVFRAEDFRVVEGANMDDAMSFMNDLILDDIYMLRSGAERVRLSLDMLPDGGFRVAGDTGLGTPGAALHLDCAVILMSPDGQNTDALVLVEVDATGHAEEIFLLPLAPLQPKVEYTLVGMDVASARQKFAQVACVSFTRGTRITLASGAQVPIEKLRTGDRVLTRDAGPQAIRWIGQSTVRATGDFAPVVIAAGALNNSGDLVVSPDHRLFVYQRTDHIGAGRAQLLVKARHLVNGTTVYLRDGGFVDYFQLLFDRHHIIYAEGIAAESMLIDPRTRPALDGELTADIPDHCTQDLSGLDVEHSLLDRPDAIDVLRMASSGPPRKPRRSETAD